ncbi:mesoderm induction early response protein 1-like [Acyrthosiphon pisum]|uniref:Mesoderm induction early response protein 1 n=1 Tax=Acyrthosiphon pisum TaxID=7029 RepID=A0A8R2B6Y2_ACYPI|nr:mesoderm induction early response protein 1-like [Acyrthosiphon pisum]|eukprot:XP_008184500.1 PREDICTED: mesoderm induction early response protein 1-like [Acyrthosiphon pisum]
MSKRVTNNRADYSDPTDGSDFDKVKKKSIMVGSDYQAKIPDGLSKYGDYPPYLNVDKLLWDPHNTSNAVIADYHHRIRQISHGANMLPKSKHVRDDENALFLLLQCGSNIEEAVRRLSLNDQMFGRRAKMWSEEECKNFENGIRRFNKNFRLIQQRRVPTRTVGELVHFYYLWKKTERHDVFANKKRLVKKKYALQPGITFYEDGENSVLNQKTNQVGNCLIYSDPKRLKQMATSGIHVTRVDN